MKFEFNSYVLDTATKELFDQGHPVAIEPQVFDLLAMLIDHRDRVVSKDTLVEKIWQGRAVSDATITSRVNLVRQAVGDTGRDQAVIRTYPKRGFRFVADVATPKAVVSETVSQATVLVLPFKDLTVGGSGFLAEGLTEDLIVALSRFADVSVIAINTAMRLQGPAGRMENPLALVKAHYLVTGSIRESAGRVRVTVQLADKGTNNTIWSEKFDRQMEDVFAVQDEIVEALAGRLPGRVLMRERQRFDAGSPGQYSSYLAYLRALWDLDPNKDIDDRIADLRAITDDDPEFAPAHAALSFALAYRPLKMGQWKAEDIDVSHRHAKDAVTLAPGNDRVLADAGLALFISGEHQQGLVLGRKAMEINPNSTISTHNYGTMLAASGDPQGGLECHRRTVALDPLFPEGHYEGMIEANFLCERFDDAIALFEKWAKPHHHVFLTSAASYALAGKVERAEQLIALFQTEKSEDFETPVFIEAFLRGHMLENDRQLWLKGFRAAGIPELG